MDWMTFFIGFVFGAILLGFWELGKFIIRKIAYRPASLKQRIFDLEERSDSLTEEIEFLSGKIELLEEELASKSFKIEFPNPVTEIEHKPQRRKPGPKPKIEQ